MDYLQRLRIREGDDIPHDIFTSLINRDLLSTAQSGVTKSPLGEGLDNFVERVKTTLGAQDLPLRVWTNGSSYHLQIWIPPVDPKTLPANREYLNREWVEIQGERIRLVELASSPAGLWQTIEPTEEQYELNFRTAALSGHFPKEWRLESLGLLQRGTLFHASTAETTRLRPTDGVTPGGEYFLLSEKEVSPTESVKYSSWVATGTWRLTRIQIPTDINTACEKWLKSIDQFVEKLPLTVRFVVPVPFSIEGDVGLRLPSSDHHIIAIHGFSSHQTGVNISLRNRSEVLDDCSCPASDPVLLDLGNLAPDRYALLVTSGRQAKAVMFEVKECAPPQLPGPMQVSFGTSTESSSVRASWGGQQLIELQLDTSEFAAKDVGLRGIHPPNIPITVELRSDEGVLRHHFRDSKALIESAAKLTRSNLRVLTLDGGHFGSVRFARRPNPHTGAESLESGIALKARWLVNVLRSSPAKSQTAASRILPSELWFKGLRDHPHPLIQSLYRAIQTCAAPDSLQGYLPHLRFLASSLSSSKEEPARGQ